MVQKASLHFNPMKSFSAAQANENERRWDERKYNRSEDGNGNPAYYDWHRKHLNFEIVKGEIRPIASQQIPLNVRIEKRLAELGLKKYKEGAQNAPNCCMDFVIGGNRERMREMAFGEQMVNFEESDAANARLKRCPEIESFALDTYRFLAQRFGEENIMGFNVHLDETTPHIHAQVIPVAEVKTRGRKKAGEPQSTKKAVSYYGVVGAVLRPSVAIKGTCTRISIFRLATSTDCREVISPKTSLR